MRKYEITDRTFYWGLIYDSTFGTINSKGIGFCNSTFCCSYLQGDFKYFANTPKVPEDRVSLMPPKEINRLKSFYSMSDWTFEAHSKRLIFDKQGTYEGSLKYDIIRAIKLNHRNDAKLVLTIDIDNSLKKSTQDLILFIYYHKTDRRVYFPLTYKIKIGSKLQEKVVINYNGYIRVSQQ